MTALSVRNLSVAYEGVTAFSGVSFDVCDGDFLAVVGENGSGKSTLIKALLGLVAPCSGTIEFAKDIKKGGIGYLPQQSPVRKDFPATVEEVVLSGRLSSLGVLPFYTKKDKIIAQENMKRLEISDMRKMSYRDLSGGQQQRVLLARALCAARKALILDEPAAGLDPVIASYFCELLLRLNRAEKLTIIMISHDIGFAAQSAGKILHLGNGSFFFGTPCEYEKSDLGRRFIDYGRFNH